ncbi:hypothetical protein D6745_03610 [Candidatus Woesearchaeota archaeon]|nr:MAG: hypothetical protein D6745_03610 [Candidatus Woesearchaeota archaeon]
MKERPNIYFAAPVSAKGDNDLARRVIRLLSKYGNVLTRHIGRKDVREFEARNRVRGVNIHDRDIDEWLLGRADCLVALNAYPSDGKGYEIAIATREKKIPTLLLYPEGMRTSWLLEDSPSPYLMIRTYSDRTLPEVIQRFFDLRMGSNVLKNLVMVDGTDVSGKGTIIDHFGSLARERGQTVFDMRSFQKEHKVYPEEWLLEPFDVILACEPTYAGVGNDIRREKIAQNSRRYTAEEVAETFSADRATLYRRVWIPNQEKAGFVERGVSTSLAYQIIQAQFQGEELSEEKVMSLAGNRLALNNPPGLLIITTCDPEEIMRRMSSREKQDNCIFETAEFQAALVERYRSPDFARIFEDRGTKVAYIDTTSQVIPDTKRAAQEILDRYIKNF